MRKNSKNFITTVSGKLKNKTEGKKHKSLTNFHSYLVRALSKTEKNVHSK